MRSTVRAAAAVAAAVAAQVDPVQREVARRQLRAGPGVAAGVLGAPVDERDRRARLSRREPRLPEEPQPAGARERPRLVAGGGNRVGHRRIIP